MVFVVVRYVLFAYFITMLFDIVNGMEKMPEFLVLDDEIVSLVNELRQHDVNKLGNGQIILDYQGHTTTHDSTDNARRRLFKWVDPISLEKDTYKKWIALNNEYEPQVGVPESNNSKKRKAIDDYLDAVLNTTVWKILYQFLLEKDHLYSRSFNNFRAWIKQLWFVEYSRKQGLIDSSGFEHVFMGEHNDGEVSGMHSWLRFYLLERNISQQFDYRGFTIKRFVSTSPEFDLALYTLCFLARQSRNTCKFQLDECPFVITSYKFIQQGKNFVGTIYPVAGPLTDKCRQHNFDKY
ncbi:Poly(U)-specific endoribonuclease [Dirofilaria immitis]|nr:Poly(U)-specific endoribonuclease [Dirofilaria immitis]